MLALDTRETVASLRAAIEAGASGFYLWPGERDELAGATAATVPETFVDEKRATIVAVHGARGGGATFVATHLAQAFARRGLECVLLDADPTYGDVSSATGLPDEEVHTIADLLPLVHELTPAHLDDALWKHPSGFRVLAPPAARAGLARDARRYVSAIVRVAAGSCDAVVISLPREIGDVSLAMLEAADHVLEVLALDVQSFRAATRALEVVTPLRVKARAGFVVNRARRGEIAPGDVERVFGAVPLAVVPADRAVPRAQDRGRLVPPRGRVGRAFVTLADRLLETRDA